jgi:hypothetical protein
MLTTRHEVAPVRHPKNSRAQPRLPYGVKGVTLAVGRSFPVYLDQQTFLVFVGTSQSAQNRALASIIRSLCRRAKTEGRFRSILLDICNKHEQRLVGT